MFEQRKLAMTCAGCILCLVLSYCTGSATQQEDSVVVLGHSGRLELRDASPADTAEVANAETFPDENLERLSALSTSPPPGSNMRPLRPVLECVETLAGGGYIAHFGYKADISEERIPVGEDNRFHPKPHRRGQPSIFLKGREQDVFRVYFPGGNLVWTLRSPDGRRRTATASPNSRPCDLPDSYCVFGALRDYTAVPPLPEDIEPELGIARDEATHALQASELAASPVFVPPVIAPSLHRCPAGSACTNRGFGKYCRPEGTTPLGKPCLYPDDCAPGAECALHAPLAAFQCTERCDPEAAAYDAPLVLATPRTQETTPGTQEPQCNASPPGARCEPVVNVQGRGLCL